MPQEPFADDLKDTMSTPPSSLRIRTVGVIGAGLSGIVTAAHLLRSGMNVTVFERSDSPGGAWKFSPQADRDPPFPNIRPPAADWHELEELRASGLDLEGALKIFDPPGPVYANMKSRGSEGIMRTSLEDWPEGKRAPLDHTDVVAYLQRIARIHHVQERILYRTQVESVLKGAEDDKWQIQTSKLTASSSSYTLSKESWSFDAVVVASGRYGPPRVPDIPGLSTWKRRFPGRVTHAKQYRFPAPYRGRTVLIIGAHISALEIANELVKDGARVYQSARDTRADFRDKVNHENAEKVAMVAEFTLGGGNVAQRTLGPTTLDDDRPIPGKARLQDGRVIEEIHHVIIATGYLTVFPFLGPLLQQPDTTALQDADETVVTTADGRTVHNLHEDIFYIPDPTLAFIGVSHFASTFSLYDFQAQVLVVVFSGKVRLPPKAEMRAEQRRRKDRLLPGTVINSIFLLDDFVIGRLMRWANKDLVSG
ncbi:hypothetical protein INS49_003706 [Diaporthe citri]|uniref:uncharacterized protein n=1 Tax=Diaporthe citri TaxID=83186 RepID=UPI001C80C027|nr:uncharacterized protein INS49_003706 [Diaporthe citri]KAG6355741.1 hypothetical protein INS49_003706 [Diaporthe citri]